MLKIVVEPKHIHGVAALLAAEQTVLRKLKDERDTEFVKRIVSAYLNACLTINVEPLSGLDD